VTIALEQRLHDQLVHRHVERLRAASCSGKLAEMDGLNALGLMRHSTRRSRRSADLDGTVVEHVSMDAGREPALHRFDDR